MNDLCISCGKEHPPKTWGADCGCGNSNTVHQVKCNGCNRVIGVIIDDDFCGVDKLYCPNCMEKAKEKRE